jgi:hypothetical protein
MLAQTVPYFISDDIENYFNDEIISIKPVSETEV